MFTLRIAVGAVWLAFWIYWLARAFNVKHGTHDRTFLRGRLLVWILLFIVVRFTHPSGVDVRSIAVAAVGAAVVACGLGTCVWARLHLGKNWGMPMSRKDEPELVISGPYALVRHPIYSGLVLALIGTALVFNLVILLVALAALVVFALSARVEERNMAAAFPASYADYRSHTRMLIPFIL